MDTIFFFNLLRIREFFTPRPTTFFIKPFAGGYNTDYQNFSPLPPLLFGKNEPYQYYIYIGFFGLLKLLL